MKSLAYAVIYAMLALLGAGAMRFFYDVASGDNAALCLLLLWAALYGAIDGWVK